MGPNTDLPTLPFWQSRSFWLTMIAAGAALGQATGINVLEVMGAADDGALADRIMDVVTGVSVVLAWGQRLAPNFRLAL
jgi:predicted membrane GTPase involved in stress response